MIWLKILARLITTLNEGATPRQIAGGLVLGFALGLMPGWPPQVWLVLVLVLILKVNLGMTLTGALLAAALAWIFDPLLDGLGAWVLQMDALQGLFTALYNSPPVALTRFNNTVMMGAFLLAVAGGMVMFPLLVRGVKVYRERFLAAFAQFRIVKFAKGSRFFGWYRKLQELGLV